MKKLFTMLFALMTISAFSQTKVTTTTKIPVVGTVKVAKEIKPIKTIAPIPSNQTFNLDYKAPKTQADNLKNSVPTSNTAIYKGENLPVYSTNAGKLFIVIPNTKDEGYHRKYIKTE